jgi:hypothetical protein
MALFVLLISYCPMNCDIHDWRAVARVDRVTCERLRPMVETERRFAQCMPAVRFDELKRETPQ